MTLDSVDTLRELKKNDARAKDDSWDLTWEIVQDLYNDRATKHVRNYVADLKLGVSHDKLPTVVSLVRYVTEQLAVIYRSPATRSLRGLKETSVAHRDLVRAYDKSGMQSVLREVDRWRVRDRQCFVRFYPSNASGKVKPVLFEPRQVMRWNSSVDPEDISTDEAFGLRTSKGLELWHRDGDIWHMVIVNAESGMPLPDEDQPFAAFPNYRSPYAYLPVVAFFEGHADAPFLAPRESWRTFSMKLSAWHNEIAEQIRASAHVQTFFEQLQEGIDPVNKGDMPREFGPGMSHLLPHGVTAQLLKMQPVIAETAKSMTDTVELWLRQENLPVDAFRQSQTVTALGLRTLQVPLRERQESHRDFAVENERRTRQAFVAVHNVYARQWGEPVLNEDKVLDVELGPIDTPVDEAQSLDTTLRRKEAGLISHVEAVMRDRNIGRPEALAAMTRIDEDRATYEDEPAEPEGGEPTDQPAAVSSGDDGLETEGGAKAQDTALNGAQITSALEIVTAVAERKLPRETGLSMLVEFFATIDRTAAERIMGPVGSNFFAEEETPQPQPGQPAPPTPGEGEPPAGTENPSESGSEDESIDDRHQHPESC